MAKDSSFDIVSEVNMQEVLNAVNQAKKEVSQRYDFKGSKTEISLDNDVIKVTTEDDFRLNSVIDILKTRLITRKVAVRNLQYGKKSRKLPVGWCASRLLFVRASKPKKPRRWLRILKMPSSKFRLPFRGTVFVFPEKIKMICKRSLLY